MPNSDLQLLFGVLGGGSVSGQSGTLILSQLNQIVGEINKNPLKIRVGLDTTSGKSRSWSAQLQKQLNAASTSSKFTIQVSNIKLSNAAINSFRKQLSSVIDTLNLDNGTTVTITSKGVGEVKKEITEAGTAAAAAKQEVSEFNAQLVTLDQQAKNIGKSIDQIDLNDVVDKDRFNVVAAQLTTVRSQYESWQAEIAAAQARGGMVSEKEISNLRKTGEAIQLNVEQIQRQTTALKSSETAIRSATTLLGQMQKAEENWAGAQFGQARDSYSEIKRLIPEINSAIQQYRSGTITLEQFNAQVSEMRTEFTTASTAIKSAGENTKTFAGHMGNLASKFSSWLTVSQVIMQLYISLQRMVTAVIDVDTAMTELRKVTDETEATYTRFLENAISRAKELGATVSDTVTATADFARLGYDIGDASQLADAAIIYKNVGDGIENISDASESIISTMQAFGYAAEDAMFIVDKFNEVGNNFAISSRGVGEALMRSASALAAGNNTLDESIALITTANTIVQNPDVVGTTMKTISMYLRAAKTEAEEAGESTDGMANSVSELRSEILALTGNRVDIQVDENTFKSTFQIIKELAAVWDSLTDITQANLLEMIGGKRNSNVVAALIENFDIAEDVVEDSANAMGSALAENEKYLDSINGKISEFKATFQELAVTFIDSEFAKSIVELGTGLLNILNSLAQVINALGGLNTLLPITIGLIAAINAERIATSIGNIATRLSGVADLIGNSAFSKGLQAVHAKLMAVTTGSVEAASTFAQLGTATNLATVGLTGLVAVFGVAAVLIQKHRQEIEAQRDAANDAASAMQENASSIEDYKNQLIDLRGAIDAGNLSEAEAYQKRQELIEIQDSLIDKFGDEAKGINLVTGSIEDQIDAIDRLSQSEWNTFEKENLDAIRRAEDLFTDFTPQDLSIFNSGFDISVPLAGALKKGMDDLDLDMVPAEFYARLEDEFRKMDVGIEIPASGLSGSFVTDLDADSIYEALDVYNELYDITDRLGREYFGANYMDYVGDALAGYSSTISEIESAIQENESIFNTYVEGLLLYDQTYSEAWGKVLAAQKAYNDAILSGDEDAAAAALRRMQQEQDDFLSRGWDNEAVVLYAQDFFDKFNAQTEDHEFQINLKATMADDGSALRDSILSAIRTFEDEDGIVDLKRILNMQTDYESSGKANSRRADLTAQEQAYVSLKYAADEYGVSVETLYNSLVDLGYIQTSLTQALHDVHVSYESLSSSAESAVTAQLAMRDVFADNTHLSEEAYNAIAALAGGESALSECVDTTNGYLVTNADALRQVVGAANETLLANVRLAQSHERLNYHDLVSQLDDLVGATEDYDEATLDLADSVLEQIDRTEMQIAKYRMLEQQVLGVTNAFTEMENARALDEETNYRDDLSGMIHDLIGSYENKEFGTAAFQTAFDALIPEDVYSKFEDAADQLDAGWAYLNKKLNRYFTYDDGNISIDFSDVQQFVTDALNTQFGDSTVFTGTLEKFDLNPHIESVEELADAMGITTTAAFALGNAISDFTVGNEDFLSALALDTLEGQIYDCDEAMAGLLEKRADLARSGQIGTEEWTQLTAEIQGARDEMESLRASARQTIHANIEIDSDITEKQKEVDELYSTLRDISEDSPEYTVTMANYQEASAELASLLQQKYDLEAEFGEPTELVVSVALESVQSDIDAVKSEIDELGELDPETNVYVAFDPADQQKLDCLVGNLDALKEEYSQIQLYAGIDDEDVLTSLETIQEFTINDKKFKVTVDGYRTTLSRLRTIQRYLDEIGDTNITTGGTVRKAPRPSVESSSNFQGAARAGGDWGLPSAEQNALVGELGQELVVDPKTGTYQTVGDNGAEFVDLPKGAIVFNHKQTEALLKNGRINSRGRAYIKGNAHAFSFVPSSDGEYVFGNPVRTPGGSTGESGLEEKLEKLAEEFEELIGDFEHSIFLLERNGGTPEQIADVYRKMQEAVRAQIEKYQKLGLSDNSDYIQELEKQWYDYQDSIQEVIVSGYESARKEHENAVTLIENMMDNAIDNRSLDDMERYGRDLMLEYEAIRDYIQKESDYYRSLGYSETSDEISELTDLWWDYANNILEVKERIVAAASDITDEIQNVNDVLHTAADEYASGGYIMVDTLQEILNMGAQYMQMLMDENGQLVINEDRINRVIAARTEQLALESALNYVERLRLALQEDNIQDLNNLLYATTDATNATWGLVYASLALLDLDDTQYEAALHNINAMRSLADSAIRGIGSMSDSTLESLEEMQTGVDDILKYVMDMLRDRIERQIDDLEEMKESYQDIIDLRKEALDAAKEETEYQDEVADRVREIADLQARINALSLDDSRDAQAQRAQLEEEMAELQEELADQQADYALNAQKESLDDMSEAYQEQKDQEIAVLENSISSYQKLYDMAIDYIRNNWNTLYQELISWNTEYGSVLNSEITEAWNNCLAAAQRYGSYVSALNNIGSDIESAQSSGNHLVVGDTNYDTSSNGEENIHAIVKQMYINSQLHHTASRPEKNRLHEENVRLASMLAQYGVKAVYADGYWYLDRVNGQLLYDKYRHYLYHKGGVVGDDPTLKQNEVMAVLEKGEVVLDKPKEQNLFRMIELVTTLSDKLGGRMESFGYQHLLDNTRSQIPSAADLSPIQPVSGPNVHFGDVYIYGANEDTLEKHREINRQFTNDVLKYLNIRR